ncbi:MAG: hypothetical protein IJH48_01065 [Oscillospiraceae bacterium]|nr:hypothetical protein [Oscillospiraceae bacterium]
MKKKKRILLGAALALIVCCVLCAVFAANRAPLLSPAPEPTPTASPEPTPHRHVFDPETGLCTLCGFACGHGEGFDAEHRCLVCRWQCRNQVHDPETALCPICGEAFYHRFGMDGICEVCGAEAPLCFAELPERYFELSAHEGRHFRELLTGADGREHEIAVWLPWDYSEDVQYNVVVLLHGDGGQAGDWVDEPEPTRLGEIEFRHVYDRMVEERLCAPFLIVGLANRGFDDPTYGETILKELVLPYIAQNFSTYLGGGSLDELRAGRAHLAVGGLSRGSMYTYTCVMPRCLDVVGNFCCFSNGDNGRISVQLESEDNRGWEICGYIASYGMMDEFETGQYHRNIYRSICTRVERVTDGENAHMLAIGAGHNFLMWTASLYDALLLLF